VIDAAERSELEPGLAAIDLRTLELTVVEAHADELAAHAAVLAELDKASGGKTMWRRLPAPA
jgi:DNA polymerase-3 subunit epsilon